MLVPELWLSDYIDIDVNIDEFCEKMIMSGSNIETAEPVAKGISGVVIGKVLSIEKHPDADRLVVTMIDAGQKEPLQIVTGATNLFAGAVVPVALHGSKLPGGVSIKRGKLRGVVSNGMLCSPAELGLDDKVIPLAQKDGIWILEGAYKPGDDAVKVLGLDRFVIDFEITPNRPDCLSMIGMAREAAATFNKNFKYPEIDCKKVVHDNSFEIGIEIKKPDLCKRYTARIIKDVVIKQSPYWIQQRLISAGMRPINNIVDITNFVMLEYGQPLHAFDIREINGDRIIVDTAEKGEKFITLDGSERELSGSELMIKDKKGSIAVAGVMGGLNSEVKDDTRVVVIESANFDSDSVRNTSKKLNLRTEASSRFEKGIDANLTMDACDRVCKLIELTDSGVVIDRVYDEYPRVCEAKVVKVRKDRINKVLGIDLSQTDMCEIFKRLEMEIVSEGDGYMNIKPPTVRQDLPEEVDFIEEVARIYGYDRLPVTLPRSNTEFKKTRKQQLRDLTKDTLVAMGVSEVQTYSFVSPKSIENIGIPKDSNKANVIRLINPLGEENSVMRTSLTPNMLEVLGRNYSRNNLKVRAFELGNTFLSVKGGGSDESDSLVVSCYGENESFFTLKGIIEELLGMLGIYSAEYIPDDKTALYHPGRCAIIMKDGKEIGMIGEVHPDVAEIYGLSSRVYSSELNFELIVKIADTEKGYTPLPKYPSTSRDIALIVDEDVTVGEIEKIISENGGKILEDVKLFDVYRGKQVDEGKKSVAFALTYRSDDGTLTDQEVSKVHDLILSRLEDKINAVLRKM